MMAAGENAGRLTDENMDSLSVFEREMRRRRRGRMFLRRVKDE